MRICVYGAGAVGGFVAALLARAGEDVSVVARGHHLDAIRAQGLRLDYEGERFAAEVAASDDPAELGEQDAVFVSVKAPSLPEVAPGLGPLLGPDTAVVTAMNGIPWWFFNGLGEFDGLCLASVDPDGALARGIPRERLLGCVLYVACAVPEPGLVVHNSQNKFVVGEPNGGDSPRAGALVAAMAAAGLGAELSPRIQHEIWLKLMGNLVFAPLALLTGATNDGLGGDPAVRGVMRAMFEEATRAAAHFGLDAGIGADERIDIGSRMLGFRNSMLQDFDKGRPVELDTIVRAVAEMGDIAGVETPMIDAVLALAARKAAESGIYAPPNV